MANIAFYGSHNAAFVVEKDGEILLVLEVERLNAYKNSGLAQFKVPADPFTLMGQIMDYIKRHFGIERFENCLSLNIDSIWGEEKVFFDRYIPAEQVNRNLMHHESHAANAFYQSPYPEALAFSFDGGGNDGFFNVYHCKRETGPERIASFPLDYGFPYMIFGEYLNDIKREPALSDGNLIYPGKIMGLVSYGQVRTEWLDAFKTFYNVKVDGLNYHGYVAALSEQIGVTFNGDQRLEGQIAYDVAATSQRAFEECFLDLARPIMEQYPELPICITGGCGLNILLNTRLKLQEGKEVFVGPSPNDCGIATGIMLNYLKPQAAPTLTYSGLPLLDIDILPRYLHDYHEAYSASRFADLMQDGKIIGVARGNSEHGPRALGNRSILCDPTKEEMKEVLNTKVKHREWYRPFAPVVRREDVNKFFEFEGDSQFMSFAPLVREEWRSTLASITHVDYTARVQTVTEAQNPFLYELLSEMDRRTGVGVLLNTSFNVDGQPILTTIKDAFHVFQHTQMDGLLIENLLFLKR